MVGKKIENKLMEKTEIIIIPTYLCEAKDEWIDSCPENCELFKEK